VNKLNFLAIFLGGGLGASARFALSNYVSQHFNTVLPMGTFFENILGSFLLGFFFHLFEIVLVPVYVRTFITIGFIGAFTTFSTYTLETVLLATKRMYWPSFYNFLIQNLFGLISVVLGFTAAAFIVRLIKGGV